MFAPRLFAAFAFVAAGLPATAFAADVTPAQATELEAQLRGWMASLVSPALDVGARPVRITADGDHFNVELPAPEAVALAGIAEAGLSVKLKAKPLDGGRWALDDLVIPSPLKLSTPKGMGPDGDAPTSVTITTEGQQFHGIFDPSFATTSSFDNATTGLRIVGESSVSSTGRSTSHSIMQPTGDGRVNILTEGNAENSSTSVSPKDGKGFTYTIEKSTSSSRVKSVSPATLATLVRSLSALVPTLADTEDSLNPAQRVLARSIVFSLRDMLEELEAGQKLDNIKFTADGHTGSIAHAAFGTKAGVTDGKLELATDISIEGFDSPEIPKGFYRNYLPRKITLKPRVSGLPSEDLVKLLLRAVDSGSKDKDKVELQEAAMGMLSASPVEIAIDQFDIDLGRASITGGGTLNVASATDITGTADISVTGLDALIKATNTDPDLKEIAPILIFLKGIGKQDGTSTVWNIVYEDNNVTVNDTDLSAMIPGAGAGHPKKK